MSTIQALITRTERELSQAAGSAVQLYAQDQIADAIVSTFNIVFREDFFPEYSDWFTRTLDGSTGVITSDVTIRRFEDVRVIFPTTSNVCLKQLPRGGNPYLLAGSNAMYVEGINSPTGQVRPFRVWPLTATDSLYIHGRQYPATFGLLTSILFEDDLMAFGAAWQYSANDGHNSAQISKFQKLFETSLKQKQRELVSNIPTKLDPRLANIPTIWEEIG